VAAQFGAQRLPRSGPALDDTLRRLAHEAGGANEDAFYTVDVGAALSRFEEWRRALPRVTPFYAVKCCGDPALVATLVALGAGFDCASPAEMELVLLHGAAPERIVYAHAVKPVAHIAAARAMGVGMMTFDSLYELDKAAACHAGASLILRIHACDPHAQCPLGNKFGAMPYEVEPLLLRAVALGMRVVGLSFHIGSGAQDPAAFAVAIAQARETFDTATRLGLPPLSVLDIGGGFSGGTMARAAVAINAALDVHFPAADGVKVIAEPGRFFAESTHTLCCAVYGKRVRPREEIGADTDTHQYYLTDGLYGSFNCLLYDHATVEARLLSPPGAVPLYKSTLFGPTCDGIDQVAAATMLPELAPGDWLRFDRMGAYTRCAGSGFNGFSNALLPTYYVFCRD
jgi:ornithine decarboxylase